MIYTKEKVKIGNYVHIANFTSITGGNRLELGDFSAISQGCRILTVTDDFKDFGFGNYTIANEFRNIESAAIEIEQNNIISSIKEYKNG